MAAEEKENRGRKKGRGNGGGSRWNFVPGGKKKPEDNCRYEVNDLMNCERKESNSVGNMGKELN